MACPATCGGKPARPRSPARAPRQGVRVPPSAPAVLGGNGGGQVVEEVTEETVYETFEGSGEVSEEKQNVLKEDLKRVHQARRKLVNDIYANMPVII